MTEYLVDVLRILIDQGLDLEEGKGHLAFRKIGLQLETPKVIKIHAGQIYHRNHSNKKELISYPEVDK